jgi:hypothetical protein
VELRVFRRPTEASAAAKARWLAELNDTLDEARRLVKRVGAADGRMDAILLYTRIETVRLEVQALRAHQNAPVEATFSPKRIELPPWQSELDRRV